MIKLSFLLAFWVGAVAAYPLKPGLTSNDSLVDVFPLSVGNQWTYYYQYNFEQDLSMSVSDTGNVNLRIIDMVVAVDSVRWVVQESGSHWTQINNTPWSGPHVQTDTFEIIEFSAGNHRMYRTGVLTTIRRSVFPFVPDLADTARVFRYARVDSEGLRTFKTEEVDPFHWVPPGFAYVYSFKRAVGLVSVKMSSTITGWPIYRSAHRLRGSIIVGVSDPPGNRRPESIALYQNYPNPFNPSTTIRYGLPRRSLVTMTVFNTLGQQVAILQNGEQEAGYHEVKFDAAELSSGVYYYRIQAGDLEQTMKLLLLR